jgi:uncharacterized Zn finger protein (UPF0148 family)
MGIKFHCPNGHKMNVKSFLAGKKGVCPKCGVGVEVPLVSEGAEQPEAMAAASIESEAKASKTTSSESAPEEADAPAFGMGIGAEIESVMATASTAGNKAKPAAPMPAVIAQDPLAQWYTCTQTGEQYGPVTGQVLSKWLEEGRVAGESLVWREGWAEWQKSAAVFPSLRPQSPLAGLLPAGLESPAPAATQTAAQPKMDDLLADALSGATMSATTYIATGRRRSYKDKLVLSSMVMIGAVVVLAVMLMLVVLNQ